MFLTKSETLKASLDEFPQNGDFFSNCNLFGVKPFHLFLRASEKSSLSKMNAKPDKGGSLPREMLFV